MVTIWHSVVGAGRSGISKAKALCRHRTKYTVISILKLSMCAEWAHDLQEIANLSQAQCRESRRVHMGFNRAEQQHIGRHVQQRATEECAPVMRKQGAACGEHCSMLTAACMALNTAPCCLWAKTNKKLRIFGRCRRKTSKDRRQGWESNTG